MQAIPDALLEAWPKHVKYGTYQMRAHGPNSNRHCGLFAQDIQAAFEEAGLDWEKWGIVNRLADDSGVESFSVAYNDAMVIELAIMRKRTALATDATVSKPGILARAVGWFKKT
jgi:hypothetical protein